MLHGVENVEEDPKTMIVNIQYSLKWCLQFCERYPGYPIVMGIRTKSRHELIVCAGALAEKYNCMIQSHMSESIDEVEFSRSLFGQKSDAEVFRSFGLLRGAPGQAASVMAHCVQIAEAEERLLKEPWISEVDTNGGTTNRHESPLSAEISYGSLWSFNIAVEKLLCIVSLTIKL